MRRLLVLLLLVAATPWPAPFAQEEADLGEAARLVVQRLEQAKAVFEQGEFARAIPLLGSLVDEIGAEPQAVKVEGDSVGTFRLLVKAPRESLKRKTTDITISAVNTATGEESHHDAIFSGPEPDRD